MLIGISIGGAAQEFLEFVSRDPIDGMEFVVAPSMEEMPSASGLEGSIGYWTPSDGSAPNLRWIHWPNAGVDDVPESIWSNPQLELTHSGGAGAVPIAEWTIGMIIFFAHRFRKILQYEQERIWHTRRAVELPGTPLRGATVGILGYGAIGREVARLCKGFGMQIHASLGGHGQTQRLTYRTPGTGDPDGTIPDRWFGRDELEDVLPEWDYIVLGMRVTDQTRQLINARTLGLCKSSAILINAARGSLVDEEALVQALHAGQIGGAALDVFETEPLPADHPLRDAPNILISPHCSPESPWYRNEWLTSIRENLRRFAAGEPLLNVVER
jgi:phosphoglycerate dehydrogenase-like enzyme